MQKEHQISKMQEEHPLSLDGSLGLGRPWWVDSGENASTMQETGGPPPDPDLAISAVPVPEGIFKRDDSCHRSDKIEEGSYGEVDNVVATSSSRIDAITEPHIYEEGVYDDKANQYRIPSTEEGKFLPTDQEQPAENLIPPSMDFSTSYSDGWEDVAGPDFHSSSTRHETEQPWTDNPLDCEGWNRDAQPSQHDSFDPVDNTFENLQDEDLELETEPLERTWCRSIGKK
eukprot:jgi/Botrbrau1/22800/Bobra.0132s0125.2